MRKVLEAIAALALLTLWVLLAAHWSEMPERVPIHFNAAGHADGWAGRGSLWLLPAVGTGMYAMLTAVSVMRVRYNVPFAVDQSRPEVRAILQQMLAAIKTLVLGTFAYIHWRTIAVAMGRAEGLGGTFLPVMLAGTMGVVAIYLVRLSRYRLG